MLKTMLSATALLVALQAQTLGYSYDALGRLKTASYPDGSVVTYTYDAAGNRSQQTVTGVPAGALLAGEADQILEAQAGADSEPASEQQPPEVAPD